MKHLWGAVCMCARSYSKRFGIVMLGSVLTGCAHNMGPPDDIAAVKGIIEHSLDDPRDRKSIIVAADGVYAVSSWEWSAGWGAGTAFLKKNGGKWKIIGTDPNWVSFCDLKRLRIPQEQGGPLILFIWQKTPYEAGVEEYKWAPYDPTNPKAPCRQKEH